MATSTNSTRLIRGTLLSASRCPQLFSRPRPSRVTPAQALGLRYEFRAQKALGILAKELRGTLERNPWFKFTDSNGPGAASPDAILWLDSDVALVVEVKYTWVPTAAPKLLGLYIPVVQKALSPNFVDGLIICKTLTPDSPRPIDQIHKGAIPPMNPSVYQWLGQGPLVW